MRNIREVLRLHLGQGLAQRVIAQSLRLGLGTVNGYVGRARRTRLGWPLPDGLDDERLEALLFPPVPDIPVDRRPVPDWVWVHRELRRPNVTLALLWEEYRAGAPDGFGYSWFCDLYREWAGRLKPTLRQVHPAGERLFVDFAGSTVAVMEGASGEERQAQVFVAVLGASSFTYACAVWTQALPDWIGAHVRAFAYFGGVARQVVSDNLKSGVTRACFHEPAVNRTYGEMAGHYGTAIVPARPYKPRDKAKAEVGVQVVQRWILARLRHQRFFSLAELNGAIAVLVEQLNNRTMRGLGGAAQGSACEAGGIAAEGRHGGLCSSSSTVRRCCRCRRWPTSMPTGGAAGSGSTTTFRSTSTSTPCRTTCCARRSRRGSPPARSSCSTGASEWPAMSAVPAGTRARWSSTCRVRIGATASGRMSASGARRPPSATTRRRWRT